MRARAAVEEAEVAGAKNMVTISPVTVMMVATLVALAASMALVTLVVLATSLTVSMVTAKVMVPMPEACFS